MQGRYAGVDLGKSAAKLVVLEPRAGGALEVVATEVAPHDGEPLAVFARMYAEHDLQRCAAICATGLYGDELAKPIRAGLPEDACLEAALQLLPQLAGALNLISVGARGYSAFSRDAQGRVRHVENDKCSAGTGETILKNAARFGYDIATADELASQATSAIAITARCSVFAKSELTHFANQGRPRDQLLRGYLDSIARYAAAMLERVRVNGPLYLIGGGSRLRTLRVCLAEHLGAEVIVPEQALWLEALGAAATAARDHDGGARPAWPAHASALVQHEPARFRVQEPASTHREHVTLLARAPAAVAARTQPAVLGLDLGSTGSKAVLTGVATGEPLLDVYDRTRGNPVEAAQRLVRTLLSEVTPDVRAIGVTGSGREAVAAVLRATYPALAERIVVSNEIVAHATAAIACDERRGESLTIVEIGGQDAKLIQVRGGQIVESDMNKACSAGTGSFLEEQAALYGVPRIEDFDARAAAATRPPDLGQMCTVFVAEAAAQAQAEGFGVDDLFAGFQYAVIHNYLNRVMGQRTFGERVFFQGKPASSPSLAWTLAAVTGRPVTVPPNPGAMGAWGIGLCAVETLSAATLQAAQGLDLVPLLSATIAERSELRCRDKHCGTLCTIERTTVTVGDTRTQVFSGGACPKFELASAIRPKLPLGAPSAWDERAALLARCAKESPGARTVGIAAVGSLAGYLPWAATFVAELGLGVRILRSSSTSLRRGEELCGAYDACAPVKVAHAVADTEDVDVVFMPKIQELVARAGGSGKTCANEQAMADVAAAALRARGRAPKIAAPVMALGGERDVRALREAAVLLGADPARAVRAATCATTAQRAYERELIGIGQRTLAYGRLHKTPVVVVCGALHVLFDDAINAAIPTILRDNGVLALPMDCFPVPEHVDPLPRVAWADLNHALRVALACRERGDAFPLLLSAFACGPASFGEAIFEHLLAGYPHTALETDGHGGNAGYVTRVQAFLHGVRRYQGGSRAVPRQALRVLEPADKPSARDMKGARIIVFPIGDRIGELAAATYRSLGFDAVAAGPASAHGQARGRRECSGKECLPYQLIWGSFRERIDELPANQDALLVQVTGQGACRNCLFSVKDRISLDGLGLSDQVELRHFGADRRGQGLFFGRFWASVVCWDILNQLAAYYRVLAPDEVEALYTRHCDALAALAEQAPSRGAAALLSVTSAGREHRELVARAAADFAKLARRAGASAAPRVLLTGDIYVRIDACSNDDLARKLAGQGLHVLVDPVAMLVEYLAHERSAELLGLPTDLLQNTITQTVMRRVRKQLYERAIAHHRWLPMPDVPDALRRGQPILDKFPLSEAPINVGTYAQAVEQRLCDGIVVAAPWGCSPALITESLLRPRAPVPTLFVYADGTKLDERRLRGFAHRLHRRRARASPRSAAGS